MSKEIPLTRGYVAIVDDEDYDTLAKHKWQVEIGRKGGVYAVRCLPRDENGRQKQVRMHRVIVGARRNLEVDHINGNGLDNRRSNLRTATRRQNSFNSRRARDGYCGVSLTSAGWRAKVVAKGKIYNLGLFRSAETAARAVDAAKRHLHGDFAALNFPNESGPVGLKAFQDQRLDPPFAYIMSLSKTDRIQFWRNLGQWKGKRDVEMQESA